MQLTLLVGHQRYPGWIQCILLTFHPPIKPQLSLWRLHSVQEQQQGRRSTGSSEQEQQALPAIVRLSTTPVPGDDVQTWIRFSPNSPLELVTNGARRVYFWRIPQQLLAAGPPATNEGPAGAGAPGGVSGGWDDGAPISYYSPPLVASDFRQSVGDFLASVFVPGSAQVSSVQLERH